MHHTAARYYRFENPAKGINEAIVAAGNWACQSYSFQTPPLAAQAGRDLQKFLLDLGKQAVPVVEVGAMRPVTVVISEGVEIEVKDIPNTCMGGSTACVN
jgi:hypothetical protein